jgi:hypothetical protein
MSLVVSSMGLYFSIFFFGDEDTFKMPVNYDVIAE